MTSSLRQRRVLVVGLGGLGCPVAIAFARAGVGVIGLVDDDVVDLTNLHRQILYEDRDVGAPKVEVAARRLRALAPDVAVEPHETRLLPSNALDLASCYDLVVEGSDNFPTKFLAADACRLANRPIVHGAAIRWHGTALAVGPRGAPCYRCLFEDVPAGAQINCAEAGVIGPVVGVVGAVQADLALGALERPHDTFGTLVTFEGKSLTARRRCVPSRPDCPLCGAKPTIRDLTPNRYAEAAVACSRSESAPH